MSVAFNGEYSVDIFNAAKRYKMQYQKGVALADSELREVNDICYSLTRQLVNNNMGSGSSTNDGFKVEQSGGTSTNNFTIKGGDGTVNGAGVLFVDGFILFLKSDIEYNEQDDTGTIVDDDYTETAIPTLTTPGAPRTDEVYVDMYFAEVSGDVGSEYQDTDLLIAGVGSATANRVRQVQDIRVAQGTTTPASGTDLNGIYHWRTKIATLNRLSGNSQILTAMITDDRKIITSMGSLSSFNPEQIFFGSAIGTIDQDALFVRDAATGNVGIGTDDPGSIDNGQITTANRTFLSVHDEDDWSAVTISTGRAISDGDIVGMIQYGGTGESAASGIKGNVRVLADGSTPGQEGG